MGVRALGVVLGREGRRLTMLAVPPVAAKSYPSIPLSAIVMRCFGAGLLAWLVATCVKRRKETGKFSPFPVCPIVSGVRPVKGLGWGPGDEKTMWSAKMPLCHPWIPARLRWLGCHSTSKKRNRPNPRLFCCQALLAEARGGRPWEWVGFWGTQSGEYIRNTSIEQNGSARRPTGAREKGGGRGTHPTRRKL